MKRRNVWERALGWLLALAMTLSLVPAIAMQSNAAQSDFIVERIADDSTMDQWKEYFGPDHLDTEFAGAVWTDKSVFKDAGAFNNAVSQRGEQVTMLNPDNFLVALSAIASNKEIVGYSTVPTDTMLVLDLSGSMMPDTNVPGYNNISTKDVSNVEAMVDAANDAINQLVGLNNYNRVGVVVYSGNTSFGSSQASSAQVLLPLGRYQGVAVSDGNGGTTYEYLQLDLDTDSRSVQVLVQDNPGNRNDVWETVRVETVTGAAVAVKSGLKTEAGAAVRANDKNVVGGTYVQSGLFLAWQQFAAVEDTKIPTGSILGGTDRMPIMVLMSDGAPTTATHNYAGTTQDGNTSIGASTTGRGSGESAGISFLTQLTAAWVRASMEEKYGREARFYTLGLGAVQNNATSLCVLDPSVTPNTINGYWNTITAPNTTNMVLTTPGTQSNNNVQLTVAKNPLITSANQKNYVDKYFAANSAEQLTRAFENIVDEIIIQSRYYPTLVNSGKVELDGYVTFEDELGEFMEVKDVKGLVVGDTFFSGSAVAYAMANGAFGNAGTYTDYGWELVNSVGKRLGISGDAAIPLLQNAWQDGQLAYNADGTFSNYIGWYADSNGAFVAAWDKEHTAADKPDNAVYLNKSYAFLGVSDGNLKDSDMMHIIVMVKTNIENGHQGVTFKIPAALIPMVTYRVRLEGDSLENARNIVLTQEMAEPIRLLFEVGLQDRVNALTIGDIMANAEHKHETADGRFYFFTNRWGSADHNAPSIDYTNPHTHLATVSHLHPSVENERYYYIENTKLYADENGTALYNGNSTAYTPRTYISAQTNGGSAEVTTEYVEVSSEVMAKAMQDDAGVWYIPKGTVSYRVVRFNTPKDDPNTQVDENYTETLEYADYPVVDHPVTGDPTYNIYNFLGNNGRMLVTPATGIRISKRVEQVAPGTQVDNFRFEITLSQEGQPYSGDVTFTDARGAESALSFRNGQATVTVGHGEMVYLTDIPEGVAYSVRELTHADYAPVGGSVKSGTVELYKLSGVDFVNTLVTQGSLMITKEVLHSYGDSYPIPEKAFTVQVDLDGKGVVNTSFNVSSTTGITSVQTDENGVFTVTLGHDDSVMIQGIEAGVTYTVAETGLPAGFALESGNGLNGTIENDGIATVTLYNRYTAASVSADANLTVIKNVEGGWRDADVFNFRLEAYTDGDWTLVDGGAVTIQGTDAEKKADLSAAMSNVIFTAPGNYYFRVIEVPGTDSNITYDTVIHMFCVVVEDPDMSGTLKVADVVGHSGITIGPKEGGFDAIAVFNNVYTPTGTANITVNIQKKLNNETGADRSLEGFRFAMYDASGAQVGEAAVSKVDGTASFNLSYSAGDIGNTFVYEIRELNDNAPGVVYDTNAFTVTIAISDDPTNPNNLNAAVTIVNQETQETVNDVVFENDYVLRPVTVELPVTKNLAGRDMVDGEFGFVLIAADSAFKPLNHSPITIRNSNATKFSFELTKAGIYYYIAGEQVNYEDNGITYDRTMYHVTVTVIDNGQGGLTYSTSIRQQGGNGTALVFNNIYTAKPVEIAIEGIKHLNGRALKAGEFSFVLKDNSGAQMQTVTNGANGKFSFDAITYDAVGEYSYTVQELNGDLGGVTYDLAIRNVVVKVTDNGEGQLEAKVYVDGTEGIVNINNTYTTTGTTAYIRATKELTGRDLVNGEFTFLLQAADKNYNVLPGDPIRATNAADGSIIFALPYSTAGDYYFVMTEDMREAKGGITYDDTHYQVHVVVYDDGNGALQAHVQIRDSAKRDMQSGAFHNYYHAAPVVVEVAALKQLHGKDLAADAFTFQLVDANTKELLQTVTNAADGTITFADLTFTKTGTYTYLIREYVTEETAQECYRYDETQYVLTVEVVDDGSGQLQARKTVTVEGENTPVQQILFENEYLTFLEVEIDKTVICNRTNQYRGPEGFQFEAYLDGRLMATYTSDADGKAGFKLRGNYIVVGTYELQIREVDQGEEHMIYDDTVYTLTLKVDYDENGTLAFFVNDNPVPTGKVVLEFENVYEGVPPVGPETGDNFDMLFIGGIALVCFAGLAVALLLLKKKPE